MRRGTGRFGAKGVRTVGCGVRANSFGRPAGRWIHQGKTERIRRRWLRGKRRQARSASSSRIKARWGRDGGLGGKGKTSRASSDRRRPQAVPVATQEATGIDSRDEGFPFPPTIYEWKGKGGEREALPLADYISDCFLERRMATEPVRATSLMPKRCMRLRMASSLE